MAHKAHYCVKTTKLANYVALIMSITTMADQRRDAQEVPIPEIDSNIVSELYPCEVVQNIRDLYEGFKTNL